MSKFKYYKLNKVIKRKEERKDTKIDPTKKKKHFSQIVYKIR